MECTNYFVQKEAHQIDPAFESAGNKYRETKQDAFQQAKPQRESFKKFLGLFAKHSKDKEINRFDIGRKFRWEDVQSEANAALEAYTNQVTFRSQPVRYLSRSFTQSASTLEAFLQFVPDGEFTFIICGALTLVFRAAKRILNLRQRILGCLDSLSKLVTQAKIYRDLYSDDPDLWQAAETLYLGILNGIEAMLSWMDESAFKKTTRSLFLQDSYGKDIEDQAIKSGIEESANNFRQCAEICLHKSIKSQGDRIDSLVNLLANLERDCTWRSVTPHAQILIEKACFIDVYGLQRIIAVERDLLKMDMAVAISDAKRISSPSAHAHAMTLLTHDIYVDWYQSTTSSILIVNGFMNLSQEQETASPFTTVSCVLYGMLCENPKALPLLYLCGQHVDYNDKYRGLAGLLRYLNAQLLFANPECVNTAGFNYDFTHNLESYDIPSLCQLLHILVTSSPRQAVFILIDGFSTVEGGKFQEHINFFALALRYLVGHLNHNIQRNLPGPVLKILFTNPHATVYLGSLLRDSVLDLPENGPMGGYGMNMYEDYSIYT